MGGLLSYLMFAPPTDPTPDPITKLTQKDRELINQTWSLAADKRVVKQHGVQFLLKLFEEYPYMQDFFPSFRKQPLDELRTSVAFRAHATSVMYALTSYVENLGDTETLVALIQKMAKAHINRGITHQEFERLSEVFLQFLVAKLGNLCTSDVESAWQKLLTAHCAVVKMTETEMSSS